MVSFVARMLGLLLFSIGLVALVADGIASIAADAVVTTPLSLSLGLIAPDLVDRVQSLVTELAGPTVWNAWGPAVLAWPTPVVTGLCGVFLMLAGARRPPRLPRGHAHLFPR